MEQKELLTVIVADDETELREAVCSVIPWKEIGFRLVGSAGNGLDALQLVEQLQPDLLLTDIRMPYISGVSLAQQVRELRPLTQIAFLSGYDDFAYAQKAIEYNVISYLLKPISMRELTEALAEIRGKIRRKFARLLPQKPEKSGWRELLLPLLLDGFAEEAQQDDPALLASLVGAGILAAGQERYSLTVLAIRLEQDGKNRTTPDMAYTVDMLLGKLCRSRSVYSGGRLLTLLIAEEEPRGLELAPVLRPCAGAAGDRGHQSPVYELLPLPRGQPRGGGRPALCGRERHLSHFADRGGERNGADGPRRPARAAGQFAALRQP